MDNYISKETAVTLLRDRAKQCRGIMGDIGGAVSGAAMLIESIPNTEVKSVVHGQWIYLYDDDHTIAVCSNCKGVVYVNDAYNLLPPIDEVKYCYHCGASMEQEGER